MGRLRSVAIAGVFVLLCVPGVAAGSVSPLPRSDYTVRAVCAAAARGRAGCLALQLVPRTAAARARRHPLGLIRSAPLAAPSPGAGAFGLRPQDLHTAYDLPTSVSSAQTVALVDAYNDPTAEADLKAYDEEFALPACTAGNGCFRQVNQNGEAGTRRSRRRRKNWNRRAKARGRCARRPKKRRASGVEYPAKTLYENELKSPGSLHDVTTGSNGECSEPFTETGLSGCTPAEEAASCASKGVCLAGTGYDGPTGVGTPDGIAAFKPLPNPPTVSSVSPASGTVNGGTPIKITGTGFVAGATVEIGQGNGAGPTAIPASKVVVVSPTEITATTGGAAKAGTFNLFVVDSGGTSSTNAGDDYTYDPATTPTVSSVSPTSGSVNGGTSIKITGTGFVAGATVEVGQGNGAGPTAIPASNVVVVSPTEITATTGGPAKAGTFNLFVIDSGGTSPANTGDDYTYQSP